MLPRALLKGAIAGLLLAWIPACSSRGHAAPPSGGDAGVVVVPNQLHACADLPACEDACRRGTSADCLSAADSYSTGEGVLKDEARAATLFEAGCALQSGPGCNLAGRMHEFGHGVPPDFAKAFSFYEKSCGLEYMGGCYNVAVLLENGRGAARDAVRATSLYEKVCAAGSRVACAAVERLSPRR
jgi:TPR repeat protein